jgi:hypothetical protein
MTDFLVGAFNIVNQSINETIVQFSFGIYVHIYTTHHKNFNMHHSVNLLKKEYSLLQ